MIDENPRKIRYTLRVKKQLDMMYKYYKEMKNLPFNVTYSKIIDLILTDEIIQNGYEIIDEEIEKINIKREVAIEQARIKKEEAKEKRKEGYSALF